MGKLNKNSGGKSGRKIHSLAGLRLCRKSLALLSLPLFLSLGPEASASSLGASSLGASSASESHQTLAPVQIAATTRYNFGRANYTTARPYYRQYPQYRKKRKYRKRVVRKSYKRRLADIQTWKVDENNKDPIQLVVSRTKQKITVYKGADVVVTSRVSSGKRGYATPTGVFSILGKRVFHRSNIYSRAPMPYMQRLTWSGVALHASNNVPAHPASHGCVRLPNAFAPKLFKFTTRGAHVIIADEDPRIVELTDLDFLRPLSPKKRRAELAKIKQEMIAKEMAARRIEAEKAARKAAALAAKAPKKGKAAEVKKTAEQSAEKAVAKPEPPKLSDMDVTLSASPLRILITRRLGRERIMDVQDMLRELGYDPGESDGYMGKDTGKAIMAFQEAHGLQKTGAFSDALENILYIKARKKPAPTGYLYVRQDFKDLLSTPITIKNPELPLGTHLITAQYFTPQDDKLRWRGMSLKDKVPDFLNAQQDGLGEKTAQAADMSKTDATKGLLITPASATPRKEGAKPVIDEKKAAELEAQKREQALNATARQTLTKTLSRVVMPKEIATRLSLILTPGSSIAVSDKGISKETTPHGTDFILLTR